MKANKQIELKIDPQYFEDVCRRRKRAEVRYNDRDYQTGDTLILREYDRKKNTYTGRRLIAVITHVLSNFPDGLKKGYVVLSIKLIIGNAQTPLTDKEVR